MSIHLFSKAALVGFAFVIAQAASAAPVTYKVFDHPAGGMADDYDYGLRLEALNEAVEAANYWSFETAAGASTVLLSVDVAGGEGSVTGTMRRNSDQTIWNLALELNDVVSLAGIGAGLDSFGAETYSGTLSNGGITYYLGGKGKNVHGTDYQWTYFSTDPGDNPNNTDFRLPNITAGWVGALSLDDGFTPITITGTNDFLGVLTPVPIPAAGLLLLGALGGLGFASRRRRRA